jgi:hypothetical protein
MGSLVLCLVILIAVPGYAAAQQGNRSERIDTGRTAVPREKADPAAPPQAAVRRGEPRGETRTPVQRDGKADDGEPQRAGRERRIQAAAGTVRERPRGEPPQAVPARGLWPDSASNAVPNHGLPTFPHREDLRANHRRGDYQPRYRRPQTKAKVVYVPYAVPVIQREVVVEREVVESVAAAPVIVEQPSLARLILDIYPPTAQVFADGYYIGIPEDLQLENGGAVLDAGPHRIDITAPGYEPVSFDVSLARGQSATFRHTLTPIVPAPRPAPDPAVKTPPAAKQPTTFYLIPGCYMGNVPPKEAKLPASCDIARAKSFQY